MKLTYYRMAIKSTCLFLFFFGYAVPVCIADIWFPSHRQLVIEEGQSHLVSIETSAPEHQQACATVHIVTLEEYENLASDPHFAIGYETPLTELVRVYYFNYTELDPAEDSDLSNRTYNISFNSGVATFGLQVTDDKVFAHDEVFVMYVDILDHELQNVSETFGNASLYTIHDNDELSFAWNVQIINVYEDEGIIDKLWILKQGNNEQNITLHIQVDHMNDTFEARNGTDFLLLETDYTVGPEDATVRVMFEVFNDTVDERPEHFYLNFTYWYAYGSNRTQPLGYGDTVTVNILERIEFIVQPANVTADYRETVAIPCSLTSSSVTPAWTVGYSNESASFYPYSVLLPKYIKATVKGINVTVTNIDLNITNYTCSVDILVPDLNTGLWSNVILQSNTGVLTLSFPSVSFYLLLGQNSSAYVIEGDIVYYRVIKEGGENLTYNVTINISESAIKFDEQFFGFDSTINEYLADLKIPNDLNLNLLEFKIMITEISATGYGRIDGVNTGEPLNITVYDGNDVIIEFDHSEITVSHTSINPYKICASIKNTDFVANLLSQAPMQLTLPNIHKCLSVDGNVVFLNETERTACFELYHQTMCCHDFTLHPESMTNGNYTVILRPEIIDVTFESGCQRNLANAISLDIVVAFTVALLILVLLEA